MMMRVRHAGDQDRREAGGSRSPSAASATGSEHEAPVTDPHVVGQLPGAQLQRLAASLQGSHGNRRVAELLTSVQRAPAASSADRGPTGTVRVETITARVTAKPSFIARPLVTLSRGDLVTPTGERRAGWHVVTTDDGISGWLHESAWNTTKPSLSSKPGRAAGPGGGVQDEIELGGRG